MSVPPLAAYTFLPWVQRGVGRAIAAADEPGAALTARVTLPVTLRVDGAGDVTASVRLYGPGDVTGLDAAQIVRRDPPPGTSRFEAGYMPPETRPGPARTRFPPLPYHPTTGRPVRRNSTCCNDPLNFLSFIRQQSKSMLGAFEK